MGWSWRKPAPAPPEPVIHLADLPVKAAWGLSTPEWLALTDPERRDLRETVAYAPRKAS